MRCNLKKLKIDYQFRILKDDIKNWLIDAKDGDILVSEENEISYAILPNLARGISNTQGNKMLLPFVRSKKYGFVC